MDSIRNKFLSFLESTRKIFITYHTRPQTSKALDTWSDDFIKTSQLAIVIQGPVLHKNNFTLETIRIYKKNFNNATIILSTWEDEDYARIKQIREEGIEILFNKKPEKPGIFHINYQIASTVAGIKLAQKLGCTYVLKTRTDIRMYATNIHQFLESLVRQFPVKPGILQKERLVVSSLITFKFRLYSPTDLTMFGNIDDMLLYWDIAYDTRETEPRSTNMLEWSKSMACEMYLATTFLQKIGRKLTWTLEDSWTAYAEHFCIADEKQLDIYWHKYDRHSEYRYQDYAHIHTDQILYFKDWLLLYTHKDTLINAPENVLQLKFKDIIPKRYGK